MADRQTNATEQELERDNGKGKTLNFKVTEEFKREFKGFAASHGVTMTDLLKEGFALSKRKRQT
jgi:hypothetical protein